MDPLTLGAIAGGTSLVGAGLGLAGTLSTNATNSANVAATNAANVAAVNSTNATNQQIASGQEAFQQQMSDTSYQRAKADLTAAGFNPMLAVSNGGASTPSGASIAEQAPQQQAFKGSDWGPGVQQGLNSVVNQTIAGANSALDIHKTTADIANTDADTANKIIAGNISKGPGMQKAVSDAKTAAAQAEIQSGAVAANNAENQVKLQKAAFDQKLTTFDGIQKRADAVMGTVDKAAEVIPDMTIAGRVLKGWFAK